jgi:hypothetical protein
MYPSESRSQVAALLLTGIPDLDISRRTGVSRSTVGRWRRVGLPTRRHAEPADPNWRPADRVAYSYLLGLYLGDGCISTGWGQAELHISLDRAHPGIVNEAELAIGRVLPGSRVHRCLRTHEGVVVLQSWSSHWLVAFPQHGPGKKHLRPIRLTDWQREITYAHPRELLRGLIHSDGCRTVNRFAVELPVGGRRTYAYPRYFFSNLSGDIRAIFTEHCDLLGIRWTLSNPRNVSISHRRSVALLDEFVGEKE